MYTGPGEVHIKTLCYSGDLQNGITFSIGSLLSLEKYVRQKTIWSLYVSHPFYPLFSKNLVFFA